MNAVLEFSMPPRRDIAPIRVRLGDLVQVVRGASPRPKGDPRYFGGAIPWIMISDVTREAGKYLFRTREHVTAAGAAKSRLLKAGTLILSNSGTVCVPKILAVDGCIHDGFVAFPELPESVCKTYLYWFFEYIRPSIIDANRQGITQVNLNTSIVRDIEFPLVSRDRQREIVAEIEKQFSRLDEAVANLQRVKANLARYRGAILSESVGGRMTFDDPLAREGWRSASLASLTTKITSGSRDWSPYYGKGESIFVLAQNVRPFSPDFSTTQRVDPPPDDPARARSRIQRGDLLVTIVGANTGQACMFESFPVEAFVCQSVALIRPALADMAPYLNPLLSG